MKFIAECSQFWRKITRYLDIAFRPNSVKRRLAQRRGECSRCGVCCKLMFKCPLYKEENGEGRCMIYNDRPGVCILYPLSQKDIDELNKHLPEHNCTYSFAEGEQPISEGDEKVLDSSRRYAMKGTFKIIVAKYTPNGNGKSNGHV